MKKGDIVYISGPYTQGNVSDNIRSSVEIAEKVKNLGLVPFVPHLYHLWDFISRHSYSYWMEICLAWVPKCQVVYRIYGDSRGADMECALAKEKGIPVVVTMHALEQLMEVEKEKVA